MRSAQVILFLWTHVSQVWGSPGKSYGMEVMDNGAGSLTFRGLKDVQQQVVDKGMNEMTYMEWDQRNLVVKNLNKMSNKAAKKANKAAKKASKAERARKNAAKMAKKGLERNLNKLDK